jgi:hypothetical protein
MTAHFIPDCERQGFTQPAEYVTKSAGQNGATNTDPALNINAKGPRSCL